MNYSESMNKRRDEARKRFRRMMAVMLFLGIVIGFLIGRVTAYADTAYKPTEGPEITVEPDTLSTDLPAVIAPSTAPQEPETTPEPEPVLLGTYRITAYCSCEICCGEWAKNRPGGKVAMFLKVQFLEGQKRGEFFKHTPPPNRLHFPFPAGLFQEWRYEPKGGKCHSLCVVCVGKGFYR